MISYKEIEEKFKLQELKEKLLSYPEKIEKAKKEKTLVDNSIQQQNQELELYSINLYNQVFEHFQDKRSNKEQRDLKFKQLAHQDKEYQRQIQEIKKLEDKKAELEIEIERLCNEVKSISKIVDLTCQELNLLSILKQKEEKIGKTNHKKIIFTKY